MLRVATTESQVGSWDEIVRAAAELGAPEEVESADGRRGTRAAATRRSSWAARAID